MNARTLFRGLLVVVLVLATVGIGVSLYQAGLAQGVAQSAVVAAQAPNAVPAPNVAPYPYYGYYGPYAHPWGFGFPFLGFLFPLFFLFLFFLLLRGLFWGGRWGHRGDWDGRVPTRFEEWHRRLHEGQPEQA
jgi:hypothetical protein